MMSVAQLNGYGQLQATCPAHINHLQIHYLQFNSVQCIPLALPGRRVGVSRSTTFSSDQFNAQSSVSQSTNIIKNENSHKRDT